MPVVCVLPQGACLEADLRAATFDRSEGKARRLLDAAQGIGQRLLTIGMDDQRKIFHVELCCTACNLRSARPSSQA